MVEYEFTTVTSKGQIVIPKQVRDRAGLKVNDKLACFFSEGFVVLRKVETPDFKSEFEGSVVKKARISQDDAFVDIMPKVRDLHKDSKQ